MHVDENILKDIQQLFIRYFIDNNIDHLQETYEACFNALELPDKTIREKLYNIANELERIRFISRDKEEEKSVKRQYKIFLNIIDDLNITLVEE